MTPETKRRVLQLYHFRSANFIIPPHLGLHLYVHTDVRPHEYAICRDQ
jgi:hypothetical protein